MKKRKIKREFYNKVKVMKHKMKLRKQCSVFKGVNRKNGIM